MKEVIRYGKEPLMHDMEDLMVMCNEKGYLITWRDVFAIGYMSGKSGLRKLLNNKDELTKEVVKYDKTDDLALLDTIGEIFLDLDILKDEGKF